ncbi:MAG: OadG family protein [Clostridia bacterium]|nr:OadG family protein [Clostridia bacterium]
MVLPGVGVVFFGLLAIVGICALMGRIFRSLGEGKKSAPPAPASGLDPAERGAVLAAVCAVIAEELGTDVSALRVRSFRKIDS